MKNQCFENVFQTEHDILYFGCYERLDRSKLLLKVKFHEFKVNFDVGFPCIWLLLVFSLLHRLHRVPKNKRMAKAALPPHLDKNSKTSATLSLLVDRFDYCNKFQKSNFHYCFFLVIVSKQIVLVLKLKKTLASSGFHTSDSRPGWCFIYRLLYRAAYVLLCTNTGGPLLAVCSRKSRDMPVFWSSFRSPCIVLSHDKQPRRCMFSQVLSMPCRIPAFNHQQLFRTVFLTFSIVDARIRKYEVLK